MTNPRRDTPNSRGIASASRGNAQELRKTLTPAERLLWSYLRDHQLGGLKFRRQHPVGPYVLDFFCPAAKLGIELDGGIHEALSEYDQDRTAHLAQWGYRIIRFSNDDILLHLNRSLARILEAARQ